MDDSMRNSILGILRRPYTRILVPEVEEGGYVAEILEFPGVYGQGETAEEAIANVDEVAAEWLAVVMEDGQTIPEPMECREFSGRLNLRMASSIHREVTRLAARDGVSINQWLLDAIAERIGAEKIGERIIARCADAGSLSQQ